MHDRLLSALLFVVAGVPLGLLGAAAFHPDGAWLFESEPLWRVFGLYAYLGLFGSLPLAAVATFVWVRRRARRGRRVLPI